MMDPAAGVVSVVLHNVQLDLGLMMELATTHESLTPRVLPRIDDRVDGAGWIVLIKLNLPIRRREDKSVQRLVIDSTFQFESRGLECDWPTFIFLCLGLGVDPYGGGLQDLSSDEKVYNLKDLYGSTLLKVYTGDNWFTYIRPSEGCNTTFSERRAMASAGLMLLPCLEGHRWVSLDVPLVAFLVLYTSPQLDLNMNQMLSELGRALTWHFYALSVFQSESEILPTPEFVLKAMERLANQLRSVPRPRIRTILQDIFNDSRRVDKILFAIESRLDRLTSGKSVVHGHASSLLSVVEHDFTDACQNLLPFVQLVDMFSPCQPFKRHLLPLNDLGTPVAICSRILLITSPSIRSFNFKCTYDADWIAANQVPNISYPKTLMRLLESPRPSIYIR